MSAQEQEQLGAEPPNPSSGSGGGGAERAGGEQVENGEGQRVPGVSPAGEILVRYYGHTDVGLIREHNEDNFIVADLGTKVRGLPASEVATASVGPQGMLLAVCDGMGGAAAGEVASQMATDTLFEVLEPGEPPKDREDFALRLVRAVEEAGHRIFSAAKMDRSRRGMGTTSTVVGFIDHVLFVGQVGDSRAYVLRSGQLCQISKDQSLVNQLIEAGQLTEEEAEAFEHSNIILQALGTTEQVSVDLTYHELCAGDRIMICSDGLSGLVHFDMIREVMTETPDPRTCCARLVELANAGGGHDNITCIVADFTGPGLLPIESAPPVSYQRYPKRLGSGEDEGAFVPSREVTMKSATTKPGADVKRGPAARPEAAVEAPRRFPWALLALLGVLLIAFGAVAFLVSDREGTTIAASPATPAPRPAKAAEGPVEVRVRTDVPGSHLFVDGEDYGEIAIDENVILEVVPGAYRFEARVGENVEATVVRTIEAGAPAEIDLRLPAGEEEGPAGAGAATEPALPAAQGAAPAGGGATSGHEAASGGSDLPVGAGAPERSQAGRTRAPAPHPNDPLPF